MLDFENGSPSARIRLEFILNVICRLNLSGSIDNLKLEKKCGNST